MNLSTSAGRRYWTVWSATLLFFGAFYTLLVPLPLYLENVGLPDWQIGFVLGAFGVASLFGRPFAGVLNDSLGSRPVILFGTASLTVGAVLVSYTASPGLLFALRILQAAGYVTFTTAATALVADLAPAARRGAALALFGVAANVAITLTPAAVSAGLAQLTLAGAFWLCGGLSLLAGGLVWRALPRGESPAGPPTTGAPPPARKLLAVPVALRGPMLTTWLFGVSFGAFFGFLPLLADRRGLAPVGLAYAVYGGSIIATRILTGRLLDRPNRAQVLLPALLLNAAGLAGLAFAGSMPVLLAAAGLIAAGSGIAHPALIAMCVDRMPDSQRGRATAGFYLAFDLGIGLGSWLLGPVLGGFGLAGLYGVAAGVSLLGALSAPLLAGRFAAGQGQGDG